MKARPILWLALVLGALSLVAALGVVPLGLVTQIAVYTLYAAGVGLLLAYTGLVPFGASVFFGCANYAAAVFSLRWVGNELLGMLFATVLSMLLGIAIGAVILRRRGLYFSLLTLACSQIAFEVAFKWTDLTGGENGLQNVPRPMFDSTVGFHVFAVTSVVAAMALMWRIVHSPFGRTLQAIRDNETRAASVGYDTYRYKLVSFVLAGGLIGWAGGLQTYEMRGAYANSLSWQHAADALLMLVLGGAHHFLGALWGAIAFLVLEDRLSAVLENWWLVFAPVIIGFVLLAPNGLHSLFLRKGRQRRTLVRDGIPGRPATIEPLAFTALPVNESEPILSIRGLGKRFGALVVADGIDLDVHAHRLHSFIGPNGAGKTTFFNMLSGALSADTGTVSFLGRDITRLPVHQRVRLGLTRSYQIVSIFPNLSAFENVRVTVQTCFPEGRGIWRDAQTIDRINGRTWSVLDAVGLADRAGADCGELSHGQKRLLEIAITIATDARLLLLDEPLAGLAEADRRLVSTLIARLARTHAVLLIEHDIDRVIAMSDRITVLHQGRLIADGAPAAVARDPAVIAAYMGTAKAAEQATADHAPASAASTAGPTSRVRTTAVHRPLLELTGVSAGYGGGEILDSIDFSVGEGEVVALLGRNGAGKTTLLKTIMGLVPMTTGDMQLGGRSMRGVPPFEINRAGIALVPEGRRLFPNLTVVDNLRLAMRKGGASLEEAYALFPKLKQIQSRRAEYLSGGERQMVAIARSLMAPGRIVLLDEPFEGLAPAIVQEVMEAIVRLRGRIGMVLVEHHAEQVLSIADRAYVLVNGRVAHAGPAATLEQDSALQASLLGVGQIADVAATAGVAPRPAPLRRVA